jgi:hypothetical protein
MCEIYKQVQIAAIAVKQSLPFSLAEWNLTMFKLRDACQCFSSNDAFNTTEARRCYNDPTVVESLTHAVNWIDELAATFWFKRVRTMHKYILAQELFWIGNGQNSVYLDTESIYSVLQIWVEITTKASRRGEIWLP